MQVSRLILALSLLCGSAALAHAADSAIVVSSCGTPPTTYVAGVPYAMTQDTTGKLCTGVSVTISPNSSVNINQVAGSSVATSATGEMKVGIVGNAGGAFDAATGAAPPANALQIGAVGSGATGGLLLGLKTCDQHAKYDSNDNGSITLATGVSGRKVYVCGYLMAVGSTATNLKLVEGSNSNCAANAADLTPAYQLTANGSVGVMSPFWAGLVNSTTGYYICINASAGNSHQAELFYTIQ